VEKVASERGLRAGRVLWIAGLLLGLVNLLRAFYGIHTWVYLAYDHTGGSWATVAYDLSEGLFYRPLISDLGYGGTRYMPLYFSVMAALISSGASVVVAGHALSLFCMAFLVGALYMLQRTLGVRQSLAVPASFLILATLAGQVAICRVAGDALATALTVTGLTLVAVVLKGEERRSIILLAALSFTLAFAAKLSALQGISAGVLALFLGRKKGAAFGLASFWSVGVAAVATVLVLASDGRATESFERTLTESTSVGFALEAPLRFLQAYLVDPANPILTILAFASVGALWKARIWKDLVVLWVASTLAATLGIFLFYGVQFNHIIDLSAALLVFVTVSIERGWVSHVLASRGLALAGVLGLVASVLMFRPPPIKDIHQKEAIQKAWKLTGTGPGRVIAENPWVPLTQGERPFLIAPSITFAAAGNGKILLDDLIPRLKAGEFRALILEYPVIPENEFHYEEKHFGKPFTQTVREHFDFVGAEGDRHFVYLPKSRVKAAGLLRRQEAGVSGSAVPSLPR